jgi:tripartite-type tricarboxylate transporter receptor subunit TctC
MNDAIAGHVDMICGSVALITPQLAGGKIRPIVQTGKTRVPALKDTQTAAEAGIPDLVAEAWWGVFAPAGTPKPMIDKFVAEASAVLREEQMARRLAETQQMTVVLGGPEELRKYSAEQGRVWGAVVKEHGIKGEM